MPLLERIGFLMILGVVWRADCDVKKAILRAKLLVICEVNIITTN